MREPHDVLAGIAAICAREADQHDQWSVQAWARGDTSTQLFERGQVSALRRMSRMFTDAADELKPTELHEWDWTPADLDVAA